MELRLYSPPLTAAEGFTLKKYIVVFSSFEFERYFYGGGKFTLSLPLAQMKKLNPQYNDILISDYFIGICKKIVPTDAEESTLQLSGVDLTNLLSQRIILPENFTSTDGTAGYDAQTGYSENIIKHYARNNLFNAAQPDRFVYGVTLAANGNRGLADDKYMARYDYVFDVSKNIAESAEIGFIYFATFIDELNISGITLDMTVGADRTASQEIISPVIFDISRRSAQKMEQTRDITEAKNAFYATMSGDEFADEAYTALYYRDDTAVRGIDRQEIHMSISCETPTAGEEYEELKRLALVNAEDYKEIDSLSVEANNSRYKYGTDYFLGDYVTVRNESMSLEKDMQIVGINYKLNADGEIITPVFGTENSNFLKILKRDLKNV